MTQEAHPPGRRHPPAQCMLGDTDNKRMVRILLECILVKNANADVACEQGLIILTDGCDPRNISPLTNTRSL